MHNTEPLSEHLIAKIYDTSLNPALWPELLEQIVELLPRLSSQQQVSEQTMLSMGAGQLHTISPISPTASFEHLVDHLQRSAQICQQLTKEQDQQALQQQLFEQLPLPALLLSAAGEVLQLNQQARHALEKTTAINLYNNRLQLAEHHLQRQFNQAIEQLSAANPQHHSLTLQLRESFQAQPISLNLSRVMDRWQQTGQVLALIACAEAQVELDLEGFALSYNISPAELRIVALLLEERTLHQIAEKNKVSINTVRSQLKAIFAKTGCHRQSELIKLALTSSATNKTSVSTVTSLLQQQHLNAPCYHHQLKLGERQLGYSDIGRSSDLPLIMFHPSTGSRLQQHPNKNLIYEQGLRLITADRAGFGLTTASDKPCLEQSAQDALQLADRLELEKFCVAGFCGGGPFALALTALAPERIIHTTLISSVTPYQPIKLLHGVKTSNKLLAYIALNAPSIIHPLFTFIARNVMDNPERYFDQVYQFLCESDANALSEPELMNNFLLAFREAMRQGPTAFSHELTLLSQDWSIDFSALETPISMWHGSQDQHVPAQLARLLCNALPNTKLYELKPHGHLLIYHCWDKILKHIKESHHMAEQCVV
ncbi:MULTISPECIES: alpha/beta fold hydrolase [unclassified Agarivorans]|uniref:alpha/beta fold hydrolase n=1 Tax=unclassified Agarivorans TaxID=2636026 RepID=UPI003D7D38CF